MDFPAAMIRQQLVVKFSMHIWFDESHETDYSLSINHVDG